MQNSPSIDPQKTPTRPRPITPNKNINRILSSEKKRRETVSWNTVNHSEKTLLSGKVVKLQDRWRLASDRSMQRLIDSDHEASSFDGFNGHVEEAPSDLISFADASEVFIGSDSKDWVVNDDDNDDDDEQDRNRTITDFKENKVDEAAGSGDFLKFVPTFSSPGRGGTDSSWGDVCDSYLTTSINHRITPPNKSPKRTDKKTMASPRMSLSEQLTPKKSDCHRKSFSRCLEGFSPLKTKHPMSPLAAKDYMSPLKNITRPDMKSPSIEKVDDVVSFNYMSPQRQQHFSPARRSDVGRKIPNKPNFNLSSTECLKSPNHKSKRK